MTDDYDVIAAEAIKELITLFENIPDRPLPEDATIENLWTRVLKLEGQKQVKKPRIEDCVKLLVENKAYERLPLGILADIIRLVFQDMGLKCKCSESSVRWYLSQRQSEWAIIKRRKRDKTFIK